MIYVGVVKPLSPTARIYSAVTLPRGTKTAKLTMLSGILKFCPDYSLMFDPEHERRAWTQQSFVERLLS